MLHLPLVDWRSSSNLLLALLGRLGRLEMQGKPFLQRIDCFGDYGRQAPRFQLFYCSEILLGGLVGLARPSLLSIGALFSTSRWPRRSLY